jgi:hypothetical protein
MIKVGIKMPKLVIRNHHEGYRLRDYKSSLNLTIVVSSDGTHL